MSPPKHLEWVITCEHAGNAVPEHYARYFASAANELNSHLGWDPGARELASFLSQNLPAPFYKTETTRLLVETNRSLHSDGLFSKFVHMLTPAEREEVLTRYYVPHRQAVENLIRSSSKPIAHLSVHTFTPVFNGVVRDVDLGLLFDPARPEEAAFCDLWLAALRREAPHLRSCFNEPYKGTDDGFTTYLRTRFADEEYLGIEIEVSQRFVGTAVLGDVSRVLLKTLQQIDSLYSRR